MFARIVSDAAVLRGKPRVRGTRMTVEFIIELVASGACREDIITSYPHLTTEDVEEAIRCAVHVLSNEIMLTTEVAA